MPEPVPVNPINYHWLVSLDSPIATAGCLTVIRGAVTADSISSAFGFDMSRGPSPADGESSVAFVLVEGGAVINEDNGFQGTRPEVLRALTGAAGRAASCFWGEESDPSFCGQSGQDETLVIDLYDGPSDGQILPAELQDLFETTDPDADDLVLVGAALVELFTGVVIKRTHVLNDAPRYRLGP